MKKLTLSFLTLALTTSVSLSANQAQAQNAILAELYGRGVHAHYSGQHQAAFENLSLAINNGSQDPRVYYFRGIVAERSGRPLEAESDWQIGARLEAEGKIVGSVGRALVRYQGHGRLKLEQIRQKAKLEYLAERNAQSKQVFGQVPSAQGDVLQARPGAPIALDPPPIAAQRDDNPFGDDLGEPKLENDDALSNALDNPFGSDAPVGGEAVPAAGGGTDPFGGDAAAGGDPFGGSNAGGAGDASDPFGGGGDDPFSSGDDPFGGSDDDPFGN